MASTNEQNSIQAEIDALEQVRANLERRLSQEHTNVHEEFRRADMLKDLSIEIAYMKRLRGGAGDEHNSLLPDDSVPSTRIEDSSTPMTDSSLR